MHKPKKSCQSVCVTMRWSRKMCVSVVIQMYVNMCTKLIITFRWMFVAVSCVEDLCARVLPLCAGFSPGVVRARFHFPVNNVNHRKPLYNRINFRAISNLSPQVRMCSYSMRLLLKEGPRPFLGGTPARIWLLSAISPVRKQFVIGTAGRRFLANFARKFE